jgi:hypothetical protein
MVRALGLALWFGCRMQAHIGAVRLADAARYWKVYRTSSQGSATAHHILELPRQTGEDRAGRWQCMRNGEGKQGCASERAFECLVCRALRGV